jgi:hypothetical protein
MGSLIENESGGIIGLIHGKNENRIIPKPFERDIFLFETHVAGTSYVEGIEELEPFINAGDKLDFFREPYNSHDERAIVIKNKDGIKIGYIPKADNEIFSRLMDAGKLLFGKISGKETQGSWLKLSIKVFLHE